MKRILLFLFLTIVYSQIPSHCFAQSKILINEFLIDPAPQSVEIFNSSTESADLSDWIVDDSGGTTFYTIPKDSIVLPNQCLVFSGDFNLNKTSADTIRLINNSQQLIDSFTYKSSSGSGISYLRQPDGANNWATTSASLGFYNSNMEQTCLFPTLTPSPTLEPTLTLTPTLTIVPTEETEADTTPTSTPIPVDNIYISEVMANPPTGEKEWVEIYNNNDFSVTLNNWYIDDLENAGSTPKIFSLEINAKSYAVFNLTSSMFNNDGDSVRLLDFNKSLKDDFEYKETEQGKTLGRVSFESDDFCLQEPSKNLVNNPCIDLGLTLPTGRQVNQTPTKNILQINISPIRDNNFDVSIHRSIDYPTGIVQKNYGTGDVLGTSDELIIKSPSNKSFIDFLTIIASSYSLLTIVSILFKMKLVYGKNKKFYSQFIYTS